MSDPGPTATSVFETDLPLPGRRRGKVRDVYTLDDARILIVASDRISAFDVVLPTPVPGKGVLLTEIAAFWFRWIEAHGLARTHLLSTDANDLPAGLTSPGLPASDLAGRVTLARACDVVPIECVVRGYLEGSGWRAYEDTGTVCGVRLPAGLRRCEKLPQPILTPATKAADGDHDENISFEHACDLVGSATMTRLREASLAIYTAAAEYAEARGILIADTKFEFGFDADGGLMLVDEALTPDSSRFWPADRYDPGEPQPSLDKQFVREFLQALADRGDWDKASPGPALPTDVVSGTLDRYREARDRLLA
ncbi:MAG: phosphoribosylaminoimidazolesuccinocarboxamide synthase [Planctomycetota bacterium]